jgi:predicted permease
VTGYLVIDTWVTLAVALFGGLMGYAGGMWLGSRRPQWSEQRRVLTAALLAPAVIAIGALAGVILVLIAARPGDWSDIVVGALVQAAAVFGLLAMGAGIVAAVFANRRRSA